MEKEEEFRRGDYLRHLGDGSSCGSHCLRLLLTTHNDPAFRSPCTHGGPTLGAGEKPETMVELVHAAHGRHVYLAFLRCKIVVRLELYWRILAPPGQG